MWNFEFLRNNLFCIVEMIVWFNIIFVWIIILLRLIIVICNMEKVWFKFKIVFGVLWYVMKVVYFFCCLEVYKWVILFEYVDISK